MAIAIIQGAIVVDRVRGAQAAIDQQIAIYQTFIQNLFDVRLIQVDRPQ
jgi:hypothetical protein